MATLSFALDNINGGLLERRGEGTQDFVSTPFDLLDLHTRKDNMLEVRLPYRKLASHDKPGRCHPRGGGDISASSILEPNNFAQSAERSPGVNIDIALDTKFF